MSPSSPGPPKSQSSPLRPINTSWSGPPISLSEAAPPVAREHWPKRQDTREFQAVTEPPKLPPVQPVPELALPEAEDDGPWAGRDFAWG